MKDKNKFKTKCLKQNNYNNKANNKFIVPSTPFPSVAKTQLPINIVGWLVLIFGCSLYLARNDLHIVFQLPFVL